MAVRFLDQLVYTFQRLKIKVKNIVNLFVPKRFCKTNERYECLLFLFGINVLVISYLG